MRWSLILALLLCSGVAAGQTPTPAPVVPDQPFVVKLAAPADGTGGFAVVVTKPSSGIARWKNQLPPGAMPLDLTDNSGRPVMVFLNPPAGRYSFALSVQLPLGVSAENPTGQDPFAEDALVVTVGGVVPIPPAPPGPTPPGPVDPPTPTIPPIPGEGVRVLILRDESAEPSLPKSQKDVLASTKLDNWLSTMVGRDAKQVPLWRKWDAILEADQITESENWKAAFAMAKERSKGVRPWIEAFNGTRTISQPLPETEAEFKALFAAGAR